MKVHFILGVALAVAVIPAIATAGIVNIDFNGERDNDVSSAGTFVGAGAAGGGTVFNGLPVVSAPFGGTNNDSLTVAASNLLNDNGVVTTVNFTVSPVGGDSNPDVVTPPAPTSGSALFQDYFFNPGSTSFQFSGLVPNSIVDVYAYVQSLSNYSFTTGGPAHFTPSGPFTDFLSGGNTLLWAGITVSPLGTITGNMPNVDVISGLTIIGSGVVTIPEPTSLILLGLGGLGLLFVRQRRRS